MTTLFSVQAIFDDTVDSEHIKEHEIDRLVESSESIFAARRNPPHWPQFADPQLNYDFIQRVEFSKSFFYIFYINASSTVTFVTINSI